MSLPIIETRRFLSNSRTTLFVALALCASFHATPAHASAPPESSDATAVTEVYGTASDGTVLHWDVYTPDGVGPWPAVLVIHGGGFYKGSPTSASESITCAQDLTAAGYIAFSIEYRLAHLAPYPVRSRMDVSRIRPTT